jgi:ABC-2 type transport system ATP-binding protein
MIEVQRLTKRYGTTTAIEDVSFTVQKGEVVGFLGPNGAGKSTTMRILSGSLGASEGAAKVAGFDVAEDPRKVQALLGYSPEVPPLYTNMSVGDYVAFAARLKGVSDVAGATKIALERVGLAKVKDRLIEHLSKGYRQRVGLAQALVHNPQVLILDEPTSGLDPAQRVEIRELIAELAAGERTVVLSTHVLGEIEAICNRVVIINRGRIVATDTLASLTHDGRTVRIQVLRPAPELDQALRLIEGVTAVDPQGSDYVVRGERDLREDVARAAIGFGLIELAGRERLEDIYLKYTTGVSA